MNKPRLRIFPSRDDNSALRSPSAGIGEGRRERELDRISGTAKAKTMPVAFGELVKFLSQAIHEDCAWLDDFADDTIQIDADLYEVLLTYQRLRRQSSAA